jgi:hypothetical protein
VRAAEYDYWESGFVAFRGRAQVPPSTCWVHNTDSLILLKKGFCNSFGAITFAASGFTDYSDVLRECIVWNNLGSLAHLKSLFVKFFFYRHLAKCSQRF